MSKKLYLDLDFTKPEFYNYSKNSAEGYEEYTTSTGNTHYRKYFDKGVAGVLDAVSLYTSDYGRYISVQLYNEKADTTYFAKVKLEPYGDNIEGYSADLITQLGSMERGKEYRLWPYKFEKDESNKYERKGVSVKVKNGDSWEKIDRAVQYTDVPKWVKEEKAGKTIWNRDAADNFFYEEFIAQSKRLSPAKEEEPTEETAGVEPPY